MNRSRFQLKGLNQERAFNNLAKHVKIYKINKQENLSTFEVDSKDEGRVKELLSSGGFDVVLLGRRGFKKFIKKIFSSYGIMLGIVLGIAFYLLQYNFVLRVDVQGNQTLSSSEIEDYVGGLLGNRLKSQVDSKAIEEGIKKEFPLASSVSVALIGQTLVININEGVIPPEMGDEFSPIISEYDALVTDVELIQGTLNVKVGDVVQKGDILVYPYIIDADGEKRGVQPRANIEADLWIRQEYCHKDYVVKTQRTGRSYDKTRVLLWNVEIYSYDGGMNFGGWEEEKSVVSLSQNNLLPLFLERTTIYELEEIEINKPFEENKEEILELARQNVLIFLEKNEIIKEEKYFVKGGGGCYFIDYIITVSKNIGG